MNRSFLQVSRLVLLISLLGWLPGQHVARELAGQATASISPAARTAVEAAKPASVLVILRAQAQLPGLSPTVDRATRARVVTRTLQRHAQRTQAPLHEWLDAQGVAYRAFYIVNALVVEADGALLEQLAARPEVAAVTTNPPVVAPLATLERTGDRLQTTEPPWGVAQIGAPQVWDMGYRGEGIVVGGQDTGYEWDHPALKAQYRGWDGAAAAHDYNWHDAIRESGPSCPAASPEPCDDHGHGTHTMGTILGQAPDAAPVGVAPGAQWIGCRNMVQGVGTPATYAECFEFFLAPYPIGGTPLQGDPLRAPDIINNSWACPPEEGCDAFHIDFLNQVVDNVRAAGIMVIASAGNRGPTCGTVIHPPAIYTAATTIGATGPDDVIATFSSRGLASGGAQKPELTAPGVSVLSSTRGGTYGSLSGTSMAAPHVTGAVALLWSARPDFRGQVSATQWLLTSTAVPRASSQCGDTPDAIPNQVYGWGRVDALAAVRASLPGLPLRIYLPLLIREAAAVHSIP
jgi:serine protease AprX